MCCVPQIIDSLAPLFPHTNIVPPPLQPMLCMNCTAYGSGQVHSALSDIRNVIMKSVTFGALMKICVSRDIKSHDLMMTAVSEEPSTSVFVLKSGGTWSIGSR
jgi:hypothetical protein